MVGEGGEQRLDHPGLTIPGAPGLVGSLAEFERTLKPRTAVPSQRYARFLVLEDEGLAAAVVTARHAAEHLRRMLEELRGHSSDVDAVLAGVAPGFFSEDHGWRDIFEELRAAGPRFMDYKFVALADYRRYLLHCVDALNQVSTDRLQSTLCEEVHAQGEESTVLAAARRGHDSSARREEGFVRDLVRLPRATTLTLRPGRDGPFELWLAKRRFRVETWAGAVLVDEQGQRASLHEGRNLVGRGLYNDAIVDATFTDVSRRHLILDLVDGSPAAITDLSSAGTFVSRALVEVV